MIRKKDCGCEFIINCVNGVTSISFGQYIKKCDKHKGMTDYEISMEPFKKLTEKIKDEQ